MYGLAFDAIYNFLGDLAEAFPASCADHYYSVIKEIKVSDKIEQEKHVKLFSAFCVANREPILEKNMDMFSMHKICYADNEDPFDMQEIFDHKDFADNSADILRHLLTISAIVDGESNAKQILLQMEKTNLFQDSSLANLFGEITRDLQQKAGSSDLDPASAIENIVKADSFKKLVSSIVSKTQNGEIDLTNLLSGMSSVGKLMEDVRKSN